MATSPDKKAPQKKTTAKAPAKAAAKAVAKAPAKKAAVKEAAPKAAPAPMAARAKKVTSMEATIFSTSGAKTGTITLPEEMFNAKWNADLVHQVVVGMQANARTIVANTKFRGEVSGGGKKPWKQKGTGRARHGSNRSPIWKGGGVTHGPRAEKVYEVKINRKMRAAALKTVLSRKLRDGEIIFVDSLAFTAPKTKDAITMLGVIAKAAGNDLATKRKNAAVIAFAGKDLNAEKSFRNIGSVITEEVRNLNPLDLMTKKYLVIERPTEAIAVLAARFAK